MKLEHKITRLEKLSNSNKGGYIITFEDNTNKTLNREEVFIETITSTTKINTIVKQNKGRPEEEEEFFLSVCNAIALLNNKLH